MSNFYDEQKEAVWKKGTSVDGYDKDKYRKDACGAWMTRDKYGKEELYGWEIDHVYPEAKGGDDSLVNLRPMQWENNRSKDDNFPSYESEVKSSGKKNIYEKDNWTVNKSLKEKLKKLYKIKE